LAASAVSGGVFANQSILLPKIKVRNEHANRKNSKKENDKLYGIPCSSLHVKPVNRPTGRHRHNGINK
jgi:hypothetical protein